MKQTINVIEKGKSAMGALFGLGRYLAKSPVEEKLLNLIYFRVSQVNGCAYCLDMHSKDLRAKGENEQRLYVLNAWRETEFYSARERAALAWAESLTTLKGSEVPDDVHAEALQQFSEEELIDLTIAVIAINSYNRLNIAFPNPAIVGSYEPGMHAAH